MKKFLTIIPGPELGLHCLHMSLKWVSGLSKGLPYLSGYKTGVLSL